MVAIEQSAVAAVVAVGFAPFLGFVAFGTSGPEYYSIGTFAQEQVPEWNLKHNKT